MITIKEIEALAAALRMRTSSPGSVVDFTRGPEAAASPARSHAASEPTQMTTLTATEINDIAAELMWQDRVRGISPEPFSETLRRINSMSPTKARMVVSKAILESISLGRLWMTGEDGIAREIARAAEALQKRRAAVGMPISSADAVRLVKPEMDFLISERSR